ncbi:MAG: chromosome segregation protein SMC [Clostridia bacterium]|nr:chromosome segregation protein SMC [Clostridia bacterium]
MYLKSLELHGFKSFPDRTLLKFNKGATVIVGPNGSGKSNITDAMRWVLGELSTKTLRGSKMEDVIFAGADDKKAMSFAEVSVTFDDSSEPRVLAAGYDEVTVTRRYYRSGESEYFINRRKVRLRDIYELFMNTGIGREGYSIVGQGRIAEILSKKSEERRGVFEESAGIARYRYQKTESEKKLAETEANMERVEDIESELAGRLGPLEKDAARARQYLELYGEKKKIDLALWLYDSDQLKESLIKTENDTKLSAHELEMAEDSIKTTSAKIERLYEETHNNKEAFQRAHEETAAVTRQMTDTRAEILVLEKETEHAEAKLSAERALLEASGRNIARERERLDAVSERQVLLSETYASVSGEYETLTAEISALGASVEERTKKLEALLERQKAAESALTSLKVRLNVQENNIANHKKRTDAVTEEIEKYGEELTKLDRTAAAAEKQMEEYRTVTAKLDEEIAGYTAAAEEIRCRSAETGRQMSVTQAQLDSLDSRIAALERMRDHFDGYNNSIKYVMNEARAGRLRGIRGPVSYLIKVEPRYTVAIETTLGMALQNIVTDDEDAAKRSIESLKRGNAGRATFYPLTTIRAQSRGHDYDGVDRAFGFLGWADELVSCDPEYTNVVRSLLARTAVFDTLDNAANAARQKNWRIRAVTLDGQQINSGGSFTGGQTKRDTGMLSRTSQIETLTAERDTTAAALAEIKAQAAEDAKQLAEQEKRSAGLLERRGLIAALIGAEQKSFSETDGRRSTIRSLVESLKRDSASLEETGAHSEDDLRKIREEILAQSESAEKIRAERDRIAAERGENELRSSELTAEAGDLRVRLAEISRDMEAAAVQQDDAEERVKSMEAERDGYAASIAELENRILTFAAQAAEKKQALDGYNKRIAELTERRTKLESSGDALELQLTNLRQTEKTQSAKKELAFIAHSKNESRLASLRTESDKLTARLWDDYEMTYAAAKKFVQENDAPVVENGNRSRCQALQNDLRAKIKVLGHVNVEAVEEYGEVKRRYDHIKRQLDDLRAARKDLLEILSGIEADMKRIFLEAFEKINTYFGETFRELFGGGHAEVRLTDPENVLSSGIEINAAPPGKTIKNLGLLSGGEQAFIAIALMFALIRVNPSPFCIFDEIEAALDEVNVARVGRYISRAAKEMQVIMISHRRGTMDIADSLYGVTMPQSGVSKVFTLGTLDDAAGLTAN